jgi:hypothetical protein
MDIKQEFKEREKLEKEATPLILAALLAIDKSFTINGFASSESVDFSNQKMFLARRLGFEFLGQNAANQIAQNAIEASDDSFLWAQTASARIVQTSQEIISSATRDVDILEREAVVKNVLNDRRADRAEYYAIDAVNGAVESGKNAAIAALAITQPIKKTWRNAGDSKVRKTHVAAQGQTVFFFESFTVGGFALKYPKDSNAPLSETANCRCGVEYSISWSKR